MLDSQSDFSPYRVLVLPDEVPVDDELARKLAEYLADGGAVLASYRSGLAPGGEAFALEELGVALVGDAPYSPDFVVPGDLGEGLPNTGHVMYQRGLEVETLEGTRVLSWVMRPYFNRTWQHFCSHQYTPMEKVTEVPIVTQKEGVIYVARPLFQEYAQSAQRVHRQVLANCLRRLLPRPRIGDHNLPSTAIVTVRRQRDDLVVHLLHYVHQRRGLLDVVEDVLPLVDVELSVRSERNPSAVQLVPQEEPLKWEFRDGYVHFRVPQVQGHQMILLKGVSG